MVVEVKRGEKIRKARPIIGKAKLASAKALDRRWLALASNHRTMDGMVH